MFVWGLGPIPNPNPQSPNPQSPIPNDFIHNIKINRNKFKKIYNNCIIISE